MLWDFVYLYILLESGSNYDLHIAVAWYVFKIFLWLFLGHAVWHARFLVPWPGIELMPAVLES